jgi:hypothetical protein
MVLPLDALEDGARVEACYSLHPLQRTWPFLPHFSPHSPLPPPLAFRPALDSPEVRRGCRRGGGSEEADVRVLDELIASRRMNAGVSDERLSDERRVSLSTL